MSHLMKIEMSPFKITQSDFERGLHNERGDKNDVESTKEGKNP